LDGLGQTEVSGHPKIDERMQKIGLEFTPKAFPVEMLLLTGKEGVHVSGLRFRNSDLSCSLVLNLSFSPWYHRRVFQNYWPGTELTNNFGPFWVRIWKRALFNTRTVSEFYTLGGHKPEVGKWATKRIFQRPGKLTDRYYS